MALEMAQDFDYIGNDRWNWWIWLRGEDAELDAVRAVEYHLHPTFRNPVREITDRSTGFRLDSNGWGMFHVRALAKRFDGSVVELGHDLELEYPDDVDEPPGSSTAGRPMIYLSAGSADGDRASELRSTLIEQGFEVRSDEDLAAGVPWEIEIARAIEQADAVVALASDVPSRWVDREVSYAAAQGVRVIPVVVGMDSKLPPALENVAGYRVRHGDDMAQAAQYIRRALDG